MSREDEEALLEHLYLSNEANRRFTHFKFVIPPGVSRALDERLGRDWRGQIDSAVWIISGGDAKSG